MYFLLFNAVTDAINILTDAQGKTENMYIESDDKFAVSILTSAQEISKSKENKARNS